MTPTAALLEEIRLLRRMGDTGRAAAAAALKSARLGRRPENPATLPGPTGGLGPHGAAASTVTLATASNADDPMKYLTHSLDAAIVEGGGTSIYATKPRGDMSSRAAKRLARWAFDTPRIHPDTTGVKPKDKR
jgi:hypothetical protein